MAILFTENTWVSSDSNVAKAQVKMNEEGKLFDVVVAASLVVAITRLDNEVIVTRLQKVCAPGETVVFTIAEISACIPAGMQINETVAEVSVKACHSANVSLTQKEQEEEQVEEEPQA